VRTICTERTTGKQSRAAVVAFGASVVWQSGEHHVFARLPKHHKVHVCADNGMCVPRTLVAVQRLGSLPKHHKVHVCPDNNGMCVVLLCNGLAHSSHQILPTSNLAAAPVRLTIRLMPHSTSDDRARKKLGTGSSQRRRCAKCPVQSRSGCCWRTTSSSSKCIRASIFLRDVRDQCFLCEPHGLTFL
jgi:hypothetical protein